MKLLQAVKNLLKTNLQCHLRAPNTFLIPISFVLLSAVYAAKPNNPRHEIRIASTAKMPASLPINVSVLNNWLNCSSTKLNSMDNPGYLF